MVGGGGGGQCILGCAGMTCPLLQKLSAVCVGGGGGGGGRVRKTCLVPGHFSGV